MKKRGFWLWMAAACVVAVWLVSLLAIPPLDYDEALYRRMAEELGRPVAGASFAETWLVPRWDGSPMFDKPPTFLWVIRLVSAWWDAGSGVSVFASRFSSWIFSFLTVTLLAFFWPGLVSSLERGPTPGVLLRHRAVPVILYGLCLLPSAGASLVLLDPMLAAVLTLPLCLFARSWLEADGEGYPRPLGFRGCVAAGIAMGLAIAVKGLIGFLLPAFAIFLQIIAVETEMHWAGGSFSRAALRRWGRGLWVRSWRVGIQVLPAFLLALALGAAFYAAIWFAGGQEFVREFFVTHHFHRGSSAMEGHGGPIYYHWLVVLLGGFPLTFWALARFLARSPRAAGSGGLGSAGGQLRSRAWFPWAWTLAFLLFFSAMATKLPNYMWPVWPALVLGVGFGLPRAEGAPGRASRLFLNFVPVVGGLLLALLMGLLAALRYLAPHVDGRARAILDALGTPTSAFHLAALGAGLLFLLAAVMVRKTPLGERDFPLRFAGAALALAGFSLEIGWGVAPLAVETFVKPVERLAARAAESPYSRLRLTTWGLRSPTVSVHYSSASFIPNQFSGRHVFEGEFPPLVLLPVWKFEACRQAGHVIREQDRWVGLCVNESLLR